MSQPATAATGRVRKVPFRRTLPSLLRDPLRALVDFGDQADGEVVRLNLGSFRPYLVTHPDQVQRVLRDNAAAYPRAGDGLFWGPLRRLFGEGILSDGRPWEVSRAALQPLFTVKRLEKILDGMGEAVDGAVDELAERSRAGAELDAGTELARLVCTAIMKTFFDDKIAVSDALRIVAAQDRLARAVLSRLLMPFAPAWFPMPGDREFRESVQVIDDVVLPAVRATLDRPDDGDDIISTLCRAPDAAGRQRGEREVRDDAVAMISASTDTTIGVLTWLWPTLKAHPDVAARLYDEIDQVIGTGPVRRSQLGELRYLRMVLDEMLRLYPVGWLIPRTAAAPDVLGGVRIAPGSTILISPYITQRMRTFWDRPDEFDPERFTPERVRQRHRYAYFPFGGGGHQCLGQHLFYLEAQLIVVALLTRFRHEVHNPTVPAVQVGAALRPQERVRMTLRPSERNTLSWLPR